MSIDNLNKIISINSITSYSQDEGMKRTLFAFRSLFNHNSYANTKIEAISHSQIFIFASEDIEKG